MPPTPSLLPPLFPLSMPVPHAIQLIVQANDTVLIHRGVSLDLLLFSWILSLSLVFLCLAKIHLVQHDGDFHEDDLITAPRPFNSEKDRDQEMYLLLGL